jgi:hypothetical protein
MKRDEMLNQIKENCQKCGGIVSQAEKTYYEIRVRHGSRRHL